MFLPGLLYITRKIAHKMGLLSALEWNVGTEPLCACSVSGALLNLNQVENEIPANIPQKWE